MTIQKTQMIMSELNQEEKNSLDVLFVGDSLVYRAVNPLQLFNEQKFTSFDASTAAQRVVDSTSIVKNAFLNQKYKVVVYNVTNMYYQNIDEYDEDDKDLDMVSRIFPIFHYHFFYKANDCSNGGNIKGYKPHFGKQAYTGSSNYMSHECDVEKASDKAINYLKEMKQVCEANGSKLLLISVPSAKNWNNKRKEDITRISKELNLTYCDLNDKVKIDWQNDTYDGGEHLNSNGSIKVSNFLGKYLVKNYVHNVLHDEKIIKKWEALNK